MSYDHAPKLHNLGLKYPILHIILTYILFLERMDMYFSSAQTRAENKIQIVLGALYDVMLNAVLKEKKLVVRLTPTTHSQLSSLGDLLVQRQGLQLD
jgi:hypothetical protein